MLGKNRLFVLCISKCLVMFMWWIVSGRLLKSYSLSLVKLVFVSWWVVLLKVICIVVVFLIVVCDIVILSWFFVIFLGEYLLIMWKCVSMLIVWIVKGMRLILIVFWIVWNIKIFLVNGLCFISGVGRLKVVLFCRNLFGVFSCCEVIVVVVLRVIL